MKLKLSLFILLLGLLSLMFFFSRQATPTNDNEKIIQLGSAKIAVEVADTYEKRKTGLSGRPSLPHDQGMLFVFSQKSNYSFWMKDMNFPLDFLWIDGDRIADITYGVPYPKNDEAPATVRPQALVDKVLEVNAGVAESSGIKIGDLISF